MREFFLDEKGGIPFVLFGSVHIGCILIVVIGLFLIYCFRKRILKIKEKYHKPIRYMMLFILFSNMAIYYGSYLYYGYYNWKVHLPLHFCFIAGTFFMIYLLTGNRKLYSVIFPLTFIGPLPAIFYPDLESSFDYYVFYQYFISHHLLMLFSYFILYMDDFHIRVQDTVRTFLLGNIIFIVMYIFNQIFGTNYIMSEGFPDFIVERYPFLNYIWPPIALEVIGIVVLSLIYGLIYVKNKEDIRKQSQ